MIDLNKKIRAFIAGMEKALRDQDLSLQKLFKEIEEMPEDQQEAKLMELITTNPLLRVIFAPQNIISLLDPHPEDIIKFAESLDFLKKHPPEEPEE